jgi:hypothetical protein
MINYTGQSLPGSVFSLKSTSTYPFAVNIKRMSSCTLYSSYRIRDFINAVSINSSLSSEPIGLAMMSLRTSKISAASEMLFSEAFTLRFQHIGR